MNSATLFESFITQLKAEVSDAVTNTVSNVLNKGAQKQSEESVTDILTIDEAAKFLNKKKKTLYALVSKREIPFYKVGGSIRFSMLALDEWMKTFRVKTKTELQNDAESELLLSTRRRE